MLTVNLLILLRIFMRFHVIYKAPRRETFAVTFGTLYIRRFTVQILIVKIGVMEAIKLDPIRTEIAHKLGDVRKQTFITGPFPSRFSPISVVVVVIGIVIAVAFLLNFHPTLIFPLFDYILRALSTIRCEQSGQIIQRFLLEGGILRGPSTALSILRQNRFLYLFHLFLVVIVIVVVVEIGSQKVIRVNFLRIRVGQFRLECCRLILACLHSCRGYRRRTELHGRFPNLTCRRIGNVCGSTRVSNP